MFYACTLVRQSLTNSFQSRTLTYLKDILDGNPMKWRGLWNDIWAPVFFLPIKIEGRQFSLPPCHKRLKWSNSAVTSSLTK